MGGKVQGERGKGRERGREKGRGGKIQGGQAPQMFFPRTAPDGSLHNRCREHSSSLQTVRRARRKLRQCPAERLPEVAYSSPEQFVERMTVDDNHNQMMGCYRQTYSQYVWAGDGTSMSGVYGWKPAGSGSCRTLRALHVSVSQHHSRPSCAKQFFQFNLTVTVTTLRLPDEARKRRKLTSQIFNQ